MADSVSVEHGGVTVTTNTASEADLRAELQGPPPQESADSADSAPAASAPVRDDKGRFAKAEPATPPVETPPAPEAAPEADTTPARDPSLPKHDPIARMKQALAQKAEAERKAAALEAVLARYQVPQAPAAPPPAPAPAATNGHAEPTFEQFATEPDPYTAYMQAWARWDRAQAIAQARADWETEQATARRTHQFQTALHAGRTAYPDFDAALTEADTLGLQVSAVMQDAIADSPRAADLVYFLATHPEECIQLAEESRQTPVAAATVMRRLLESRLSPRVPAPTTQWDRHRRAGLRQYREASGDAGRELACRVR